MYKQNSGFSLVELLLVLGVAAALVVAAFIIYPEVAKARDREQQLAGQEQTQHSDIPVVGLSAQQPEERKQEEQRKKEGRFHSEFENGF